MKVCDKTCIFCFFLIINKYLCMAKRSLLSRCPSYCVHRIPENDAVILADCQPPIFSLKQSGAQLTQEVIKYRKREYLCQCRCYRLDNRILFRNDFSFATTRPAINHRSSVPRLFAGITVTGGGSIITHLTLKPL